jgi:monoamine oxidase
VPGYSPLTQSLRRMLAAQAHAERTGIPVDEVLGMADAARTARADGPSRRAVLAGALGAAGAVALGARPAAARVPSGKQTDPTVAIVGAGLAGVRAAHWLWTVKGIRSTVYEGDTRVGGRLWSLRDWFDHGQVVEHGGAFINTDHNALRNLVNSLGLSLREIAGGNQPPYGDIYWADGAVYTYDEANADWGEVYRAFKEALAAAPYPQTAFAQTAEGRRLDLMSVDQWIEDTIPGGLSSRFGQIMQSNAIAEYGLDPGEQSALNLVYLLGWNAQNSLSPINGSDERFGVVGGNDQIITRMLADLPPGTVRTDHTLVAVRTGSGGSARLTFRSGSKVVDVTADRAILALPFTTLRDVDFSGAGFSAPKVRAIQQLGLGANGKIHVQLTRRPWLAQQLGGVAYTPVEGFQCLWDDTVNQPGDSGGAVTAETPGILCYFPGGSATLKGWKGTAFGPAPSRDVADYLRQTEPLFPGVTAAFNGLAWRDAWHLNPWSMGAYTCPRPGQYTDLFGIPELPEGPFHFAGEHTSSEYYGFLNGAVESGERAAKEVALA